MTASLCMHYYISGKVQGVCFRTNTQRIAESLNLTGWVCNLSDGRVEVLACGNPTDLAKLTDWLRRGPELAYVTGLEQEELPWENHNTFAQR